MPMYRFECEDCGRLVDQHLTIAGRKNPRPCQQCDSTRMERIIVAPYMRPESMYRDDPIFGRVIVNDYDNPLEEMGLEPGPPPDYKSKRIQVDVGDN